MLIGCSVHHVRDSKKYASVYARWQEDDGSWLRYKIKLCAAAYTDWMDQFLEILESNSSLNVIGCAVCGKSDSDPPNALFLTNFLPGREPTDPVIPIHNSCAKPLLEFLRESGEPLKDRGGDVGASDPNTPNPWDDVA